MANWMFGGKPYDNLVILFRFLASFLMGIGLGARVARDWPLATGWLKYLRQLSALVFLTLAQSRSKQLASRHS
jgi:phage-related holin